MNKSIFSVTQPYLDVKMRMNKSTFSIKQPYLDVLKKLFLKISQNSTPVLESLF